MPLYGKSQDGLWLAAASGKQRRDKGKSRCLLSAQRWENGKAEKLHETRFPWAQATHTNRKSEEYCGTARDLAALGPRLKGPLAIFWRLPRDHCLGKKPPVSARSSPHTQGETDNPVSVPGFYCGPQ